MYRDKETEASYIYLENVIRHLDRPICLLGGWAVYFLANPLFREERGYPYIGSRDIDLGFDDVGTMEKAIAKLTELGFKRVSFRYFKQLHSETLKELDEEEAKKTPLPYIFPMYVDLILPRTDSSLASRLGFAPVDEPLLKYAFDGAKCRRLIREFGKEIILPSPALLLAMKIRSVAGRDKEHKKTKDICDIAALCLYSGVEIERLKAEAARLLTKTEWKKNLGIIGTDDIEKAARLLALEEDALRHLVERLRQ